MLLGVFFTSWLSSLAVAGAVAAVPVIIHLLNRKRYVIVNWAAMRFLMQAQKKNVRRLKLEQWILLLIRMFIGLLVVLAMLSVMSWAEPLWQRLFPGGFASPVSQGRVHRIIVVDGSFGMAARNLDEATRFEVAKSEAKKLLDQSSPGDGFSLIFLATPAQVIVPGPVDDSAKVKEELDALILPHGSADLAGGLNAIAEMVNRPLGKYLRREVYFFTDLKQSTWPLPAASSVPAPMGEVAPPAAGLVDSWQRINQNARVVLLDCARQDVDNLAVTSVTLGEALPLVEVNTALSAVVQNFGRTDRRQVKVEFLIGQSGADKFSLKTVEQKLVDIQAGSSTTVNFALEKQTRFREAGDYVLQVRIEPDFLPLDDVRSLAVTVRDSIPVMLVNGKPSSERLERASEWLSLSLYPFDESQNVPGFPARPRTLSTTQFSDAGLGDLTKVDCVFLCDVPRLNGNEVARLETHLRRGGAVVIGLGPNASKNLDAYNRLLYNDGKGLLPGRLTGVKRAEGDESFSLTAEEEAFKQPPLAAFRNDNDRAGLTLPRFKQYVQLEAPVNGPARRLLSYLPVKKEEVEAKVGALDPAVVEWPRYRGRVIVFTSTFNTDWNNWPLSPTFPPFVQELLRFAVTTGTRQTLTTGEVIEDFLPSTLAGLTTEITRFELNGEVAMGSVPILSQDEAGLSRFTDTDQSGVYRLTSGKNRASSLFGVNVPLTAQGGGPESDLRRFPVADAIASAPESDLQVVPDIESIQQRRRDRVAEPGANLLDPPEPRGPAVARVVLLLALGLMIAEMILAWRLGSARAGSSSDPVPGSRLDRSLLGGLGWVLIFIAVAVVGVILHALITGDLLGFLSTESRESIERSLGVPKAAAGEGTRWRLESMPYLTGEATTDHWLNATLILLALGGVFLIYFRERIPSLHRTPFVGALLNLGALRFTLFLLMFVVLLPQLRLSFEREGWPDLVLVFDDSRSMATVDTFRDPQVRDRAEQLKKEWAKLSAPIIERTQTEIGDLQQKLNGNPSPDEIPKWNEQLQKLEARLQDLRKPHRLNLIKALLASSRKDWLQTLVGERRMRVHLMRASSQVTRFAELTDPEQCQKMLDEIMLIVPEGESTQLGNAATSILKSFRGGSLNGIILFTDGVTTKGEDLTSASRLAARMNVPIYSVGIGDAVEPPDLILRDLQVEDSVNVNDRLVFETRLQWQGPTPPDAVPVILSEIKAGKKTELTREMVKVDPTGKPVKVRLVTIPTEPGEKSYVIETPVIKDEVEPANNRQERQVFVAEEKRLRVLLIESYPRYEFRYIKSLFERETEKLKGNKSIDLRVLLLSAHQDFHTQDRSAVQFFPSSEELQRYDVVILGDVDPKQLPKKESSLGVLNEFVKQRGGGLLLMAGKHFSPLAYRDTPLADLLPVTWEGLTPNEFNKEPETIAQGYRLKLTPEGQSHPLFRFVGDEVENLEIWNRLQNQLWFAKGYKRKLSAEVLAVHPERPAEGASNPLAKEENHPLILQQFVGAGRVMFFGFDETWRWRFREDELRFNQFWIQTIRALARNRVGRVEVRLDRQTAYRRDEPIKVTVRFPDDAPPPNPDTPIRVTVERTPLPQGGAAEAQEPEMQTLTLAPREGTRATYETLLTRTPEGDYKFTLTSPTVTGAKPKAETRVLPPPGELDRLQLNEADLQRAARESHGSYYPLHKAHLLLEELPEGPRVALDQPSPPVSLWNHWSMFALFFSMLALEWVLRKRYRLL